MPVIFTSLIVQLNYFEMLSLICPCIIQPNSCTFHLPIQVSLLIAKSLYNYSYKGSRNHRDIILMILVSTA